MVRTTRDPSRTLIAPAFLAFAAFGLFWGVWGGSVPQVRDQAGISDGQLGFALLFVGAGALPAMLLVGRALDRWGLTLAAGVVGALGVVGAGMALTAFSLPGLCVGLALVGASSGAADVAMNVVAGRAEKTSGRPVITRAHGLFSSCVLVASLATGLAFAASLPLAVPFIAVACLSLTAGIFMIRTLRTGVVHGRSDNRSVESSPTTHSSHSRMMMSLLLIGVLGALAFAIENAHQSWSAVFVRDELHVDAGPAAVAPGVFAGTVAVTRFCISGLKAAHAQAILVAGALAAAAGAAVIAAAPTLSIAALGLVVAAAGTSVVFPTLLGIVSRNVEESHRARATSIATTVSYLGFLLGPVYVGLWADAVGLRGAMVAVAALAVGLIVLAPALLHVSGFGRRPPAPGPGRCQPGGSGRRPPVRARAAVHRSGGR
ncbi:MFS transporter [Plantactinospora sp. S1510]|uniref:MFS transporter n=1 Tax=Plantactinospora alkalitolerans TaxID=2789879 RepID=A0ABS0GRF3_9ACTN|nr:MFS transporter [Plantactinospora alkalitolerans]MBF9128762.1 MFS transporter [Plantactinospora alkalitolerans]